LSAYLELVPPPRYYQSPEPLLSKVLIIVPQITASRKAHINNIPYTPSPDLLLQKPYCCKYWRTGAFKVNELENSKEQSHHFAAYTLGRTLTCYMNGDTGERNLSNKMREIEMEPCIS